MIPTVRGLDSLCCCYIYTRACFVRVLRSSPCSKPRPQRGQYLQFGRFVTLHTGLLYSRSGVHLAFLCNHTVLKGEFSVGSLAEGMFSIRAAAEGVQFSRERERESAREEMRMLFLISIRLPHRKRHVNNILYKLLQQHTWSATLYSSELKCTTPL